MGYQRMTRAEWEDLVAKKGIEEARNIVKNFNTVIVPDELPAVNPAQPAVTNAPASATMTGALPGAARMNEETGMMGGLPKPQAPATPDTLQSLSLLLQQRPQQMAALRQQQLEESRNRINQMYQGPSTSDRLWALSRALLAPRPYGGFAGTMYNVTQGLSGLAEQRKTAQQQREDALFKLQQQYRTGQFEDESEAIKLRYQIAKEQADAEREAAKERRPKIVPVTGGGFAILPGTGGLPEMPEVNSRGQYVITDIRQIAFLPRGTKMVRADDPMQKEGIAPGPTQ